MVPDLAEATISGEFFSYDSLSTCDETVHVIGNVGFHDSLQRALKCRRETQEEAVQLGRNENIVIGSGLDVERFREPPVE